MARRLVLPLALLALLAAWQHTAAAAPPLIAVDLPAEQIRAMEARVGPRAPYHRDCNRRVARACLTLASMFERGIGGPRRRHDARMLYQDLCSRKIRAGCAAEQRLARERQEAGCDTQAECARRCEEQIGPACTRLALFSLRSVPRKLGEAARRACDFTTYTLDAGCQFGDARGCVLAANANDWVPLYEVACDRGDADGCVLREAALLDQADEATVRARMQSLEQRCAGDQHRLACAQAAVAFLPALPERALAIVEETCRRGGTRACKLLAPATRGEDRSATRASRALRRACELDHVAACVALRNEVPSSSEADRARARIDELGASCRAAWPWE